jgi:diguanylate cyclase (GGDEF)-like protein
LETGDLIGAAIVLLREFQEKNRLMVDAARLEQLNAELSAVQAELVRKNEELAESRATWERLAMTDPLTELANRRAFEERLREEIARFHRYGHTLTLLLMDVDLFKQYNDTFGHPAGDVVLHETAHLIRQSLREGDLVARYGGEEFVALLPQTGMETARLVAERIGAAVGYHPFEHRRITLSIGAAELSGNVTDAASLIASADKALYAAKQGGRNRVVFAHEVKEAG